MRLRPRPRWGSLQRSPDPVAGFGEGIGKGGMERAMEGKRTDQGEKTKGVKGRRERGNVNGNWGRHRL